MEKQEENKHTNTYTWKQNGKIITMKIESNIPSQVALENYAKGVKKTIDNQNAKNLNI